MAKNAVKWAISKGLERTSVIHGEKEYKVPTSHDFSHAQIEQTTTTASGSTELEAGCPRQKIGLQGRSGHPSGRRGRANIRGHYSDAWLGLLAISIVLLGKDPTPLTLVWPWPVLRVALAMRSQAGRKAPWSFPWCKSASVLTAPCREFLKLPDLRSVSGIPRDCGRQAYSSCKHEGLGIVIECMPCQGETQPD